MKCKDIPDLPVLQFLATHGQPGSGWCNWCFGDENDVHHAMPDGTPDKLVLAKMRMLMRKGLVSGCDCGCRGDFILTDKGWIASGLPKTADWWRNHMMEEKVRQLVKRADSDQGAFDALKNHCEEAEWK